MRAFLWGRKMPLPNILEFIGTNITQRKFQQAQEKLLNYLGVEVPTKADLSNVSADLNAKITPKANKADVDTALSKLSTNANKYYSTLAAATADIANIALNQSVTIGEEANKGLWYKATAGATSLTKSPYDPLTQANTYTDNKVKSVTNNFKTKALMVASTLPNDSYAMVTEDTEANNGLYVKTAGIWVLSKYSPIDKNYLDSKLDINDENELLALKDANGHVVVFVDKDGNVYLPHVTGSLQSNLKAVPPGSLKTDNSSNLYDLKDSDDNTVALIDSNAGLHLPGLPLSVQSHIKKLDTENSAGGSVVAEIKGKRQKGSVLYAELPDNKKASSYRWQVIGEDTKIADKSFVEITDDLVGKSLSVTAKELYAGDITNHNEDGSIGGVALESEGLLGTLYEGFILSDGDDFNELDIVAPHRPLGRWFTTRTYLAGARGSDTLLGTMYNTDPYHTGYMDSNRGAPVGYDAMQLKNGYVRLGSRVATNDEKKHFQGNRNEVASLLTSVGAFSFYAGDKGTGDTILEFKVRHSLAERNPHGWHPSLWTQSSLPSVTFGSDEWDISEGTHDKSNTNYNSWGKPGSKGYGTTFRFMDNEWHLVTAVFNHSRVKIYLDENLVREIEQDANIFNEPAYALVSNHIYNGEYAGSIYSKEMWDMFTKGTYIDVDFVRIWRKQGTQHIKPLVQIPPVNVDYGSTATITLPPKTELWGDDTVLEHVQIVMTEENEPGGHHTQAYNALPSFANYDEPSRTLTVDTSNQKSGRLNVVIYGYKQDGSSCSPARTYINVAPRITVDAIEIDRGSSYDLYIACDCGVLVTDGVKRIKKIEVLGLPVGVVYNDETGLVSVSNNSAAGDTQITVQCVNSVNQVTTKQVTLKVK